MLAMAAACDMFTGAELAGLCREAAITALREDLQVVFLALFLKFSLVMIGLLYMAFLDSCWHKMTFLLRPRPYPVRGDRLLRRVPGIPGLFLSMLCAPILLQLYSSIWLITARCKGFVS